MGLAEPFLSSIGGGTRELHTRLLRARLNFPSQLSEARQAIKKMAASPTMAITSFAITIK